jgi:hypothetical protein
MVMEAVLTGKLWLEAKSQLEGCVKNLKMRRNLEALP